MIVLSGTIGAGKTSLTTMLAEHLGSNAYYESVDDNPILPLFYDDPKRQGVLLQNYFLNQRLDSITEAQTSPLNVIDRSIYEDRLLFQLNADLGRATQIEASTYSDLLNNMMEQVDTSSDAQTKDPDLLIHISVSFETMLERIKRRGRDFEQIENDPSLYEYYKELTERYTKWFEAYDRSPKLQIDGDQYDFVEDEAAAQEVLKQVDDALAELNLKA